MQRSHLGIKLKQKADLFIPFPKPGNADAKGAYHEVKFGFLPSIDIRLDSSTTPGTPLEIAYSKPKNHTQEDKEIIHSHQLVMEKRVPADFNHVYFFLGSDGKKISPKALCDLGQIVEADNKFSANVVIEMIGQVLLSVYDYHSRGLVHQDIKVDNFLAFQHNGKYIIKIADHDTVAESDRKASPCEATVPKPTVENNADNFANLELVDCFALGHTISLFANLLEEKDQDRAADIMRLSAFLVNMPHQKTIHDAMHDPIFGADSAARTLFFTNLRKQAQQYQYQIDGNLFNQLPFDNVYWLLDRAHKPIYQSLTRFADEVEKKQCLLLAPKVNFVMYHNYVMWLTQHAKKLMLMLHTSDWNTKGIAKDLQKSLYLDVVAGYDGFFKRLKTCTSIAPVLRDPQPKDSSPNSSKARS